MKRTALTLSVLSLASGALHGQSVVNVRSAFFVESYHFRPGLSFSDLTEYTVPIGVDVPLGRTGKLSFSSGWASVKLTSAVPQIADERLFGPLDTEARLTLNVIPGRLTFIANGSVPTGKETVTQDELAVLGAISSDLIGFAASDFGAGGDVGGGFVGAFPVGRFALGLGGTYRQPLAYVPVIGQQEKLKPGGELRVRSGLEGPIGRRSYLRVAGIFALRAKDAVGGAIQNGVGNRYVGYVSFNQGIASSSLILYGFDVYRADPLLEPTATGSAILPRGNLLAAGARWAFRVGPQASITPRTEFRNSANAVDESATVLRLAGRSLRGGLDFRYRVSQNAAIVFQGDGFTGFVKDSGREIGIKGFRFALHLEVSR